MTVTIPQVAIFGAAMLVLALLPIGEPGSPLANLVDLLSTFGLCLSGAIIIMASIDPAFREED